MAIGYYYDNYNAASAYPVFRPMITLKPDIPITGGNGSISSPYEVE